MSRVFYIEDERGTRQLDEADLPLSVGGVAQAAIVLPGVPAESMLAQIAYADGYAFIQALATDIPLFHNHERLDGSKWLKSGDQVQAGDALLTWQVRGDQVTITTRQIKPAELTPPPGPPPVAARGRVVPEVINPPVTSAPRRWRYAAAAGVLLLLLAAAFVLLATPFILHITPPPDRQSISGFPPAITLGERRLALPGRYTVTAGRAGYRSLQQDIEVAAGDLQTFRLQLEELPGRVRIQLDPDVPYEVFVDEKTVTTDSGGVTELPGGRQSLRIETARYLPVIAEVDITGKGQEQSLPFSLQPGWAELHINTQPPGAQVTVDGRLLGETPLVGEIMQGPRTLVLALEKYKPVTLQQTVTAGVPVRLAEIVLVPADGELEVSSQPAGATISVGGVFYGATPATLALASGQPHRVRLTLPGYQTADRNIELAAEEQQTLAVTLVQQYGVVFVSTRPADATLVLDGKPVGKATRRLRLTTRPHTLKITQPGYVSQQVTVTPRAGVSKNVDITLQTREQQAVAVKTAAQPATRTTAAGQVLRLVRPAGSFRMGASRREAGRRANESQRLVRLQRPFYLGEKEVTNAGYRRFRSAHHSGSAEGASLNSDSQPVVNIGWIDAARYCNWLSQQDGLPPAYRESGDTLQPVTPATTGYRLPTEAEWAYVARRHGRQQTVRYPWSGAYPPSTPVGNYADISIADTLAITVPDYNDGYRVAAPVGSFPARAGGLYDLGGNVAEWTNDYYAVYPGMAEQQVTDPGGPATGDHHVVRDASWRHGSITELRLSYRDYSRGARPDLGFRIARYAE